MRIDSAKVYPYCRKPIRFWQKWIGLTKITGEAGCCPLWTKRAHFNCWSGDGSSIDSLEHE